MATKDFVIGVDYGTDSVRSVIVDASTGATIGSAVHAYTRWKEGRFCDPGSNRFRQHPLDYLEGLEITIRTALEQAGPEIASQIRGLSIDTTGSTPIAVDAKGTPLALTEGFEDNPNAMFVLWKDHTATTEADEINHTARTWGGEDFTRFSGGVYSSEWFFSKILHVLRQDHQVREAAFSWVEQCDWLPALLTGDTDPLTLKRSRCAAGHKAMWHQSWDGLPPNDFLAAIDPLLDGLRDRLYSDTWTADSKVGTLSDEWAKRLGLSTEVAVGVGAFDAHMGAVGAEIAPYTLSKVMGTSTCDMLIAPNDDVGDKLIGGICGQVDGSITPGMLGMEAGQSAFGDLYAWFRQVLAFPLSILDLADNVHDAAMDRILPALSEAAAKLPIGESEIVAVDWMNGRRTPYANQQLTGAIAGLSLGSDAPRIFRALVEATAFGSKAIIERFREEGIRIERVIALGGIPQKSPLVMQICADVLDMPMDVAAADQACALGAAMFAATAAGLHPDVEAAQQAMGAGMSDRYEPIPENVAAYKPLYERYQALGSFLEDES